MKKFIFISLLLLSIPGFSQKRISFGFRLSGSNGMVSSDYFRPLSAKTGYSIGGLTEIKIVGPLSIRTEVMFANRGFKDEVTFTDASGNAYSDGFIKTSLNYLDVPVMAKFSFGKIVKPYFLVGGKGSLFINGKIKYPEVQIPNSSHSGKEVYKETATSYDYSAIGGFGFDINISKIVLFTDLRYNHSFVGVNSFNTKFRTIELSAGLKF